MTRLNKIITEGSASVWEDEYRFKKADGDYAYVHDRGHIIYDRDELASRMIGATQDITARNCEKLWKVENFTEKVLLENKLVQERLTRQREITNAVLTAQENERADIGKELHDNLNQILGAAKLYIEMARTDEENREMCLDKSAGYILQVIEEIRKISKTLATPGMHVMGLSSSIKILLDDMVMIHPIKIEFHEKAIDEDKLNKKLQLDIYRIVQEQLNNILKHSKASCATINLTMQNDEIKLLISDNGEGCDILQKNSGVGILNIKSRAELYNGRVTIISKPGEGYELNVVLPLKGHI